MNNHAGNPFATPEQELLLQAAWLPGESARQAWQNWQAQINLEQNLDAGSYRLLPLVYHNLHTFGVSDPVLSKFKGIYRKEWYKNQTLFRTLAEVLRLFQAAGIETLILKGAAMAVLYYPDYGLRPMDAFDVLIPTTKRHAAIDALTRAKWKPLLQLPLERLTTGAIPEARHAWSFENADQSQFDLHWNVLLECRYPKADDDFWSGSIPVQVAEVSTRALNPTDQLLQVCVQAMSRDREPPLQWIADAMMILTAADSKIDWSRLSTQAEKRRLTLPLYQALTYLHDSLAVAIPAQVLTEMSKARVSDVQRKLHAAITTKPTLLGNLPQLWYRHLFDLEATGQINWAQKLARFPRYVQGYQGLDRRHLLLWAISRPFVRIGKAMRGLI
jgi:hypothetical protein